MIISLNDGHEIPSVRREVLFIFVAISAVSYQSCFIKHSLEHDSFIFTFQAVNSVDVLLNNR